MDGLLRAKALARPVADYARGKNQTGEEEITLTRRVFICVAGDRLNSVRFGKGGDGMEG